MARKKSGKRANNEGSITQSPNGKFRVTLSVGYNEDGTRNRVSKVFGTRAEANAWRIEKLAMIQDYGTESAKNIAGLFVPALQEWLIEVKQNEVYHRHYNLLMRYFHNYIKPYFKNKKQKDLVKNDFQKFFAHLEKQKIGVETRRKIKGILRQYFEKVYENTPMRNPLDGIKIEKKKEIEIIDPNEFILKDEYKAVPLEIREKFFKALDDEKESPIFKPMCYIMYFMGNRIGEVLALQWKDINFQRRYFLIYKSVTKDYDFDEEGKQVGKGRTILKAPKTTQGIRPLPLIDVLYEVLSEWYEFRKAQEKTLGISFTAPDDFVFANNDGQLRSPDGTITMFNRFLKRHNLNNQGIHFHALRQTFSNTLFSDEADENVIVDLMGHASIETTKKHYKTVGKFESAQKAARRLNELFKPKDATYCADDNVTFAPEGYQTEVESTVQAQHPTKESESSLKQLFDELSELPEFQELLKKVKSHEPEM